MEGGYIKRYSVTKGQLQNGVVLECAVCKRRYVRERDEWIDLGGESLNDVEVLLSRRHDQRS